MSDGPSDRYSPPSAHVAIMHGETAANVARIDRGTLTCGRSASRQRPWAGAGSGVRATAPVDTASAAASTQKTRRVGSGASCTSSADPSAPTASPASGAELEMTAPRPRRPAGSVSSSDALSAAVARPTATPCTVRATSSQPVASAMRKTAAARMLIGRARSSTGLRPMWSDSRPASTNALSSASTYTANTRVRTMAEKPYSRS